LRAVAAAATGRAIAVTSAAAVTSVAIAAALSTTATSASAYRATAADRNGILDRRVEDTLVVDFIAVGATCVAAGSTGLPLAARALPGRPTATGIARWSRRACWSWWGRAGKRGAGRLCSGWLPRLSSAVRLALLCLISGSLRSALTLLSATLARG
jgi:hypothetical protein